MAYVITDACVDVKDRSCVDECPVDCIYEGERMLYIHPRQCIDCGACVEVCPVGAIFRAEDVPAAAAGFVGVNAEFFSASVTGWWQARSASSVGPAPTDHPAVVAMSSRR